MLGSATTFADECACDEEDVEERAEDDFDFVADEEEVDFFGCEEEDMVVEVRIWVCVEECD